MNILGEFDISLIPWILIHSAALSSTDLTMIIPTLNILKFKRSGIRQIAISGSALTDISSSVFTKFLLLALVKSPTINNGILNYFMPLL